MAGRVWNISAGIITVLIISSLLSISLQGYYYLLNSLVALLTLMELGLNFAIVQFSSHEMVNLDWTQKGTVKGSERHKKRLRSIMLFALSWFSVCSAIVIMIAPIGYSYFANSIPDVDMAAKVGNIWLVLIFFGCLGLFLNSSLAVIEGCGKVFEVAVIRLVQGISAVIAAWITFFLGGELYALPIYSFFSCLVGITIVCLYFGRFFQDLLLFKSKLSGMSWRYELWPFQWRIALSWASGYFITQAFIPIAFNSHGPELAGQVGMSMHIIYAMNGVALAWFSTKAPLFGGLVASRDYETLDTIFWSTLIRSLVFIGLVGALFIVCRSILEYYELDISSRMLSTRLMSILVIGSFLNHVVYAQAAYLRAHKIDPFVWISIFSAVVTTSIAVTMIPLYSENGVVAAIIGPQILGFIACTVIFLYQRKTLHSIDREPSSEG